MQALVTYCRLLLAVPADQLEGLEAPPLIRWATHPEVQPCSDAMLTDAVRPVHDEVCWHVPLGELWALVSNIMRWIALSHFS
jgi:hypothetical protein